jgi:hypothetical protein
MQLCNCSVLLAGSLLNRVPKKGATVAEIVVLRAVHGGDDAVRNIQPVGMDKRTHAGEFARLCRLYGAKRVKELFPGANPQLPVNLADIGVSYSGGASGSRSRGKKAEAVEEEANDAVAGEEAGE